jgi:hypothetical protein
MKGKEKKEINTHLERANDVSKTIRNVSFRMIVETVENRPCDIIEYSRRGRLTL